MPQIDFSPEHKTESRFEFDRLKLKRDERARIACLEKPTFAWVHTLKAPKIVNGEPVKVQREWPNGEKFTDFDNDFIGRPLCLGDYGVIQEKGIDPANCPACEAAKQSEQVAAPDRRFAMNVIRYNLNRDGKVTLGCSCVVWSFTGMVYNKLTDIATEYGSLRDYDLLLGPCTNEPFQKFEIMPAKQASWRASDEMKRIVTATYTDNRVKDLEVACGRKQARRYMEEDLRKVSARWAIANGTTTRQPAGGDALSADTRSLADGMADLLDMQPAKEQQAVPQAPSGVDIDSAPATPKSDTKVVEADPLDFAKLMDEI